MLSVMLSVIFNALLC